MTISAFLPVFNEEKRIADALTSLMWCDEIILVDKSSTDNTVEIALSFGAKVRVYSMNNSEAYDSSEWNLFLDKCNTDWTILFTASDVIHPNLANDILKKIRQKEVEFDIINIPFKRYVLGLDSKRSPWFSKLSPKIIRKSSIIIKNDGVHNAAQFVGKQLNLPYSDIYCMYHLTHESVDIMMDRHIRYWRAEATAKDASMSNSLWIVFKSFFKLTMIKKTPLLGYDGIALLFSFLSYQMMSYVYQWEKKRGNASGNYHIIKEKINLAWRKNNRSI